MKKFCSTCGNHLELSQRFCSECGAVNPFFVAAFTLLSDQSQSLEKLRIEKERIEKELSAKEDAQKEFERQEQLKRELEELEKQKAEQLEKERALRERLEREKIEASLKKEILQVKEEAEIAKKETIDLVREVRKEVKQEILEIGQENKRLKHEVEILSKQIPEKSEPVAYVASVVTPAPVEEQPEPAAAETVEQESSHNPLRVLLGMVILLGAFLGYFYYTNIYSHQTAELTEPEVTTTTEAPTPEVITPPIEQQQVVDTVLESDAPAENTNPPADEPVKVSPAVYNPPAATPPVENPKAKSRITEAKVMADLNGKKISGCGVTIGYEADLNNLSNLVLVEKSSNYTKYKCTIKLSHGDDTYTAVPYLYYTDDGMLTKIDGSNCE